jgi:hypothetical protein
MSLDSVIPDYTVRRRLKKKAVTGGTNLWVRLTDCYNADKTRLEYDRPVTARPIEKIYRRHSRFDGADFCLLD